jgi:hypothetical protein
MQRYPSRVNQDAKLRPSASCLMDQVRSSALPSLMAYVRWIRLLYLIHAAPPSRLASAIAGFLLLV